MKTLWKDIRYAFRQLRNNPGIAAIAILTLAIGIGATTVIFSVVDAILIEPFTYSKPDRLTQFFIHDVTRPHDWGRGAFSVPEFMDFREQNHVFEDVTGYAPIDVLYSDGKTTLQFDGCWVTGDSFEFHGVKPALGRWITLEDAKPDSPPVFVMSDRLWSKQFNRDPKIVGTIFTLNSVPTTLVGIMPPRYLVGNGDIGIPISITRSGVVNGQTGLPLYLIARGHLKPGVSIRSAAADLDVIARQLSKVYIKDYPQQFNVMTMSLTDVDIGDFRGMLYALIAAVLMVLLIACSNVANLLLARATAREREIAIRAALGADRGRLVRQLLVESFILSIAACGLGCVFAYFGLRGVVTALPVGSIPPNSVFVLNLRALAFSIGIAALTALLCGLAPSMHALRGGLQNRLTGSGKGAGGGYRHGKLRAALVITEVALSIILLIGTGLMLRTLVATMKLDLGFNPANVLAARLSMPKGRYDTAERKKLYFQSVLRRVTGMPGVISATANISMPPYGGILSEVAVPGKTHAERWNSLLEWCSEGYFQTLGLHLLRGRLLSAADVDLARHVIVINQLLARNYFNGEDAIGKTIKFNFLDQVADAPHAAGFEIIGIVGDFKNQGLQEQPLPEAFTPYTISGAFNREIMVKTATDPLTMLESVRREVWAVDSNVGLTRAGSIESYLQEYSYAGPEFGVMIFAAFAGIGLVLVAFGVFSVMAYSVSLQTHEIGIRMAIGAQRRDILRLVIRNGLILIGVGTFLGLLTSFALTRLMSSQIWGVSATDPLTFLTVVILVSIVGLAACFAPARRATRVDPLIALRYE
jgi:putative ABC transport system permease protein